MMQKALTFLLVVVASMSLMACQTPPAMQPTPDSGTLISAETMQAARAAHTATTLPDGRVLLVGGISDETGALGRVETFDPVTNQFTEQTPLTTPRQSHTATLLPDGRVLLAGGYDEQGTYLASAELFDPANDAIMPAGTMGEARAGHVAVALPDGRVLLAGGVGSGWTFLASAELYDPETNSFAPTGSMTLPRESHAAVGLDDGRVLVIGGHQGRRADIELYTNIEMYTPASGSFAPAGDMTVRRHKHDAVLLPNGLVLISGGTDERDYDGRYDSAELYDPATATSRAIGPMQSPRYKHHPTSIVLPDGRVLLAGGSPSAELYDPASETFLAVESDASMVGQFSATALLPDGRVLITGGYGEGQGPQAAAWLFQP